jgi:lipopolysaccharide biosynthesis regulator YciM
MTAEERIDELLLSDKITEEDKEYLRKLKEYLKQGYSQVQQTEHVLAHHERTAEGNTAKVIVSEDDKVL